MKKQNVSFPGDRSLLEGYLVYPDGVGHQSSGQSPGVLVVHEIYGLTEDMRQTAEHVAAAGYVALAVDLFAGKNKPLCMAKFIAASLAGSTDHEGIRDLKLALSFLSAQEFVNPEKLGAIGFCLGGGFAMALACKDKRLKVVAPFYASNPRPLSQTARICPLVGSYPEKDMTAAGGRKLDAILTEFQIPHDVRIYPGAKHSFMNPLGRAYNEGAAHDAWDRTFAFFEKNL